MNVLFGPFPFDPAAAQAAARAALSDFARAARAPGWRPPDAPPFRPPGLYLLVDTSGERARLAGFWVAFGVRYFQAGPMGAPEVVPPFVAALLEAVTEAVWWRDLPVSGMSGGVWRPLVVLEWPPPLAVRSALPPPGVARALGAEDAAGSDEGNWLLPTERGDSAARRPDTTKKPADAPLEVAKERSLLCVVRAHLQHDASSHRGYFVLLGADRFPEGSPVPAEEWMDVGAAAGPKATPPGEHALGPALALPQGGVGYPISGWLTRALDLWPARPADVARGELVARDVRSARTAQVQLAVLLTVVVFAPTLALALLVRSLTEPLDLDARVGKSPDPQPAISVCSADHQKFVDEFRCQIGRLADGSHPEASVCSDAGSKDTSTYTGDLQPELCGLLDRARDNRTLALERNGRIVEFDALEFVASQACFDVLGHPEPYELARLETDLPRRLASPSAFLDDPSLGIRSLQSIVDDLDRVCDGYRGRLEARVEGAVFATHLGLPPPPSGTTEANTLRNSLVDGAVAESSERDARCFRAGVDGALDFSSWPEVCGATPRVGADGTPEYLDGEPPAAASPIWAAMDPVDAVRAPRQGDLVDRYVRARFGTDGATADTAALWTCHLDLARGLRPTAIRTAWDLTATVPHAYDVGAGAIRAQLELDALLPILRGGGSGGVCWSVVSDRLARYTTAHPLVGAPDDASAWSVEQQVCGQACAANYGFQPANVWITRNDDLRSCFDTTVPPEPPAGLDRLVIPWFGEGAAARRPTTADVCAFNLIAQRLLPEGEEGLLVGTVDPVAWAGETRAGSRIAGGAEGAAAAGARNLSSYGQSRSRETCANVAAQCFVSVLVGVAADKTVERYRWPAVWAATVSDIPAAGRRGSSERLSPWCAAIAPHLSATGVLPDGQFDFPCASGVEEQRMRVAETVNLASRGVLLAKVSP